jgi:hypothetical protein
MHEGDNAIFNVNGRSNNRLRDAIKLAAPDRCKLKGFRKHESKGLIFYWTDSKRPGYSAFPAPLTAEDVFPMVVQYLASKEVRIAKHEGWDANADHDGDNVAGWRVYVEDWGHVDDEYEAAFAVKFAWIWLGK